MTTALATDPPRKIYAVSELNQAAKRLMEQHFNTITVSGEISNLAQPASGHLYFSLKDQLAQIKCAFFKGQQSRLTLPLAAGQAVIVTGRVSLYAPRGDYQLIVSSVQPAGLGALEIAFQALKKKLSALGWFDLKHKKSVPLIPQQIGVITSPTGAAVRDILTVLKRRFPLTPVLIYPTVVQGTEAKKHIANAIDAANSNPQCDVLILARGGGSIEDLFAFNEEEVAQAIFKSTLPIVTGIGHETDTTIADLVADHRAATPSAAAEYVSPDQAVYQEKMRQHREQLIQWIKRILSAHQKELGLIAKQLKHPKDRLKQHRRLHAELTKRLLNAMAQQMRQKKDQLARSAHSLNTLSPLKTLERGYSITTQDERVISRVEDIAPERPVSIRLSNGQLDCHITQINTA